MSSKILVKIHAVLRKLCPCALLPHVPYCPCALLPMCPILQGPPSLSEVITNIPFTHVPHCPCATLLMCQKDVKLSKGCQIVKKMSNCQKMSKNQTHRLWRRFTKKINWHNEVHIYFDVTYDGHQNCSKKTFYAHFEGFWWPSYVTSKLTLICVNLIMSIYFFMNLLHSLCVWHFDIWHLFDILTSFLT